MSEGAGPSSPAPPRRPAPRVLIVGAIAAALGLGLFIQWPSLRAGFRSDDFIQRAMLRGEFPVVRSRLDLFDFARGTPHDTRKLLDFGYLGWWASPELRLRMFRPLASGLIALDHALFGDRAEWHHVHSLVWFGLLLIAAGRVYFELLPAPAAVLALLWFTVGPCHTVPVAWLANRSTLIAAAFGLLALDLQLHGRRRWLISAATSCALLAGEYALTVLAYALAYAFWSGRDAAERRFNLAPVALPIAGYIALRALLGGDVAGSGFYISPIHDPLAFARAVATRVPVLIADLLLGVPSIYYNATSPLRGLILSWNLFTPEVWQKLPSWQTWHVLIGYAALAVGFGLWRLLLLAAEREASLPRSPASAREEGAPHAPATGREASPPASLSAGGAASTLRWMTSGALLSLVPCAASLPEDRLLVASTLASSTWVACALCWAVRRLGPGRAWPERVRAGGLALLALGLTYTSVGRSYHDAGAMREGATMMQYWALDADLPRENAATSRVYVLAAAEFNTAVTVPWLRLQQGLPLPRSYRRLCPGPMPFDLRRSADSVLEAHMLTNAMEGSATPSLYRSANQPLRQGDHVELPGLRVDVLSVLAGNPTALRFTFDRSVDDPSLFFLISSERGLRRSAPPKIGEFVRLPYAQFRDLRF